MKRNRYIPPPWIRRLLTWLHPENTLEEPGRRAVESDLDELYQHWAEKSGRTIANFNMY